MENQPSWAALTHCSFGYQIKESYWSSIFSLQFYYLPKVLYSNLDNYWILKLIFKFKNIENYFMYRSQSSTLVWKWHEKVLCLSFSFLAFYFLSLLIPSFLSSPFLFSSLLQFFFSKNIYVDKAHCTPVW